MLITGLLDFHPSEQMVQQLDRVDIFGLKAQLLAEVLEQRIGEIAATNGFIPTKVRKFSQSSPFPL